MNTTSLAEERVKIKTGMARPEALLKRQVRQQGIVRVQCSKRDILVRITAEGSPRLFPVSLLG